jgi:diacylglycerol kinase (ATP)
MGQEMIKGLMGLARRRFVSALVYSIEGFGAAWNSEEAIKVEMALLPILVGLGLYFGETGLAKAMLVSVVVLVVVVELLNTAIEKTIDRISTEHNPLSKKVKDMGSAAVLGAILNAVVVWVLVLM